MTLSEPPWSLTEPTELLLGQLRYYRATLLEKLSGLTDEQLRTSILPSGWAPLALLKHLAYVERRWVRWGFAADPVPEPWGDDDPATGRWLLRPEDTLESLAAFLADQAEFTEATSNSDGLGTRGRVGGRFEAEAPTLGWILLHLLQEYARHLGHLDVVRELLDGRTGE